MKKVLIIIAIIAVPFLSGAQSNTETTKADVNTVIKTEVAIKKVDPISINPKTQNLDINFKKSNDITSIKAYIKSLQLKRKETLMS